MRDLRSFIGLCSYYHRFVRGFAEVASPLHALTGARFEKCSEECQVAFEKWKEAPTTSPVLVMPSDEGRYVLDTDASETSIGTVLSQVHNGEEWVITYGSGTYNKAERNYCTTMKVLLAVVHFIRQFKQYFLGSRFLIRMDHAAPTWLQRASDEWACKGDGKKDYKSIPSTLNTDHSYDNADDLSRLPCGRWECCKPR